MPAHADALAQGIVWQPDNDHLDLRGDWDRLGVNELLVQWIAVDDVAFMAGAGIPAPRVPDWVRIANEPWARGVIVGLAGYSDEKKARENLETLVERSLKLAAVRPPVHITGWYFPVEVDPTWTEAPRMAPLLEKLPHPLWISVYDTSNMGGEALAKWLDTWLPKDVGVLLRDGCGARIRGRLIGATGPQARAHHCGGVPSETGRGFSLSHGRRAGAAARGLSRLSRVALRRTALYVAGTRRGPAAAAEGEGRRAVA